MTEKNKTKARLDKSDLTGGDKGKVRGCQDDPSSVDPWKAFDDLKTKPPFTEKTHRSLSIVSLRMPVHHQVTECITAVY